MQLYIPKETGTIRFDDRVEKVAYSLRTARLSLRTAEPSDAPKLSALMEQNRASLTRWIGASPHGVEAVLAWLRQARAEVDLGQRLHYVIAKHDGTIAGMVQLGASGELGFWLGSDHQGRGLATEAAGAVARAAFDAGRLAALVIVCATDNQASAGVAERLGFQRDAADETTWRLTNAARLPREVTAYDALGRPLFGYRAETSALLPPTAAADWAEVVRDLRARFPIRDHGDDVEVELWFELDGRPEKQGVRGTLAMALGEPWVVVTAAVCSDHHASSAALLRHNRTLAVGALCLDDGGYAMRYSAPLCGGLELTRIVTLIGHEAARLRRSFIQAPDPSAVVAFID